MEAAIEKVIIDKRVGHLFFLLVHNKLTNQLGESRLKVDKQRRRNVLACWKATRIEEIGAKLDHHAIFIEN